VVRGGAFNNNQRNVRCAYRNNNDPNNWNNNIGFRLVVAHDFPSLPGMPGGPLGCPAEARKPARSVPGRAPGSAPGIVLEAASGPGK
jgi:hypothetical protein